MIISESNYSKEATKFIGNVDAAFKLSKISRVKDLFSTIYDLVYDGNDTKNTEMAFYVGNQLLTNGKAGLIKCDGSSVVDSYLSTTDGSEYDVSSLALIDGVLYIGGLA